MVDRDDTRRTTDDERRTTPRVWHKLPTGELKTRKQRYLHDLSLLTAASVKGNGAAMLQWLKPGNHYWRVNPSLTSVLCPDYTSPDELKWLRPRSRCISQFLD